MAVNNRKVCMILREKLDFGGGSGLRTRLINAWKLVLNARSDPARSADEDFACADHYLQNRIFSSFLGPPAAAGMAAFTAGYAVVKLLLPPDDARVWEENKNRASPTSAEQVTWGMRGIRDGLDDFFSLRHPVINLVRGDSRPSLPSVCGI